MAYRNSQDNEFDPEMERILQEHFDAEASDLRSPGDPWAWLESRMEEPGSSSFFSRLLGGLKPLQGFPVSPAFAGAAVAVVAVAVVATVWAVSGNGDPGSPGGMASPSPADAPASTARPTAMAWDGRRLPSLQVPLSEPTLIQRPPARPRFPFRLPCRNQRPPLKKPWKRQKCRNPNRPHSSLRQSQRRRLRHTGAGSTCDDGTSDGGHARILRHPRAEDRGGPGRPHRPCWWRSTSADTTFRDYQRQPFVAAAEDNVSTFSLDTDRTSFQLALNWARSGYAINPDSVRAEECSTPSITTTTLLSATACLPSPATCSLTPLMRD